MPVFNLFYRGYSKAELARKGTDKGKILSTSDFGYTVVKIVFINRNESRNVNNATLSLS